MRAPAHNASGFSLVELSIVLVILGLLVGGVLTGQSLIRAAELRAVTTEAQRYAAATQTFRDKYFAIPGDIRNATAFWPTVTTDGDGDGILDASATPVVEMFRFWQHLALAGLIEGSFTGVVGGGDAEQHVYSGTGANAPVSKLTNTGWSAFNRGGDVGGPTGMWTITYGNSFLIGGIDNVGFPDGAGIKPEEAWNIDTKMDDGKPGTGKVAGFFWTACSNAASETDYAATYLLSSSAALCHIRFLSAF